MYLTIQRRGNDKMKETAQRLLGRLEVDTEFGSFLGDTRVRLLEAVEKHGSISQAARAVPLSYKAAWDAIDAMNNLAEQPLVIRSTGGRNGGGTRLTEHGRRTVALYRALEAEYQGALATLAEGLSEGAAEDLAQFRQLLRRMSMKSSARNQFAGTVVALREGQVDFEVRLRLDPQHEIAAVITRDSAESLGIAIGSELTALVKSSSVLVLADPQLRISARNQLWGEVSRIHRGPVNAEVSIALPGGRAVCAVITQDSVDRLALTVGSPACAAFKASSVILCQYL